MEEEPMFGFCIENGQSKTIVMKFMAPTLMCNPCTLLYNLTGTCLLEFLNGRFLMTGWNLNHFELNSNLR